MTEPPIIHVREGDGSYFHVGDLIRLGDERVEVTATADYVLTIKRISWWRYLWLRALASVRWAWLSFRARTSRA
jgi:hypothetical protein